MRTVTVLSLALFIFTPTFYAQNLDSNTPPEPESLSQIRTALQAKRFEAAIKQIDSALDTAGNQRDFLLYLKGLALFYNNQFTDAIQVCDQLLRAHPDSAWGRKTTLSQSPIPFQKQSV